MSGILQHLGWGLFHSLWIIAVLAALYGVIALVIPKRLRYCVGYAILLAMLILPAVACFMFDPIEINVQQPQKRAGGFNPRTGEPADEPVRGLKPGLTHQLFFRCVFFWRWFPDFFLSRRFGVHCPFFLHLSSRSPLLRIFQLLLSSFVDFAFKPTSLKSLG